MSLLRQSLPAALSKTGDLRCHLSQLQLLTVCKTLLSIVVSFSTLVCHAATAAESAESAESAHTYSDLFAKARVANYPVIRAQTESDIARVGQSIAERDGRPSAQITSTLSGRLETDTVGSGAKSRGTRVDLDPAGSFALEHASVLGITIPIWDGGRTSAKRNAAAARSDEALSTIAERDHELAQTLARLCTRYLGALSFVGLAELQEQSAATKFEEIKSAYRRGERSELDLTRAEFERARAVITRDRARGDAQLIQSSFGELINSPGAPPRISLPAREPDDWQAFAERLKNTPLRSPSDERMRLRRQALQAEITALDAASNPQINAQAGAGVGGQLEPLRPLATTHLQFILPLPWNRTTSAEKERLLLQLRSLDEEQTEDKRARAQGQLRAVQAIELLRAEREALRNQLGVLQRYRNLMKRRFEAGRASALELSESEDQELLTKLELERLQNQISERVIDLADAVGFSDFASFFEARG